jgi:hypothetical protein
MPDFNTQRTQERTRPNKLRALLTANWLRTVLISVGILFFVMVVVPSGLLIYQYSEIGDQPDDQQQAVGSEETVTCDERYLSQAGLCVPPHSPKYSVVCGGKSRDLVIPADLQEGYCLDAGELHRAECGGVWVVEKGECIPSAETLTCDADDVWEMDECNSPEEGEETVECYSHYVYRDDNCIEPLGSPVD